MKKTQRRREDVPFDFGASCGMPAYAVLAGVRFDRLFLEAEAIIEAYRKGMPLARGLFGPDVGMGGPGWAGNSYGHVNALGAPLTFPEDSEVGVRPIYGSLAEGIRALKKEVDFEKAGLFPRYVRLWEDLKKAFPDKKISFSGFKAEGPITTAWCLRGHGFFTDILESPEEAKEYLRLVTESIIKYQKLERRLNGQPEFIKEGMGLCDDVSAMISPTLWPEMVVPFLEQYYSGQSSGNRSAHIEDLTVRHLKFLDELGLDGYDPSVSEKLTPALIRDNCRVPFTWRLNTTHYPGRSCEDIERWVFEAAAGGASGVTTVVDRVMCTREYAQKIRAFIRTGKEVKRLLAEGCPREKLREHNAPAKASEN